MGKFKGVLYGMATSVTFGLIPLIAKGYGTICWGFLILFAIPVLTIGIYKIKQHGPIPDEDTEEYNTH